MKSCLILQDFMNVMCSIVPKMCMILSRILGEARITRLWQLHWINLIIKNWQKAITDLPIFAVYCCYASCNNWHHITNAMSSQPLCLALYTYVWLQVNLRVKDKSAMAAERWGYFVIHSNQLTIYSQITWVQIFAFIVRASFSLYICK